MRIRRTGLFFPPLAVVGVGVAVYVLAAFQRVSPPVVALEIMRDLRFSPDDLSLMFAATMISYGFMQPVAGFWADRFGPTRCLLISAAVLGLASFLFSLAQGLWLGLLARTLVGVAAGLALMPCLKLAGQWFSPAKFGLASSCIVASAALSNFLAGRPLAQAAENFGWRGTFAGLGLAGLILAGLVLFIVSDRPPRSPAEEPAETETPVSRPLTFLQSLGQIARKRDFWTLAALYACTDMLYGVFTSLWAGPYLIEVQGQTEAAVGNMLSLAAAGFLIGPPLLVLWSTLWKSYSKVLLSLTVVNTAIALLLVHGPGGLSSPSLYVLCFIAPVGAQAAGLVFVLARNLFPEHLAASAMGFINIFAIVPGALMQNVVGWILAGAAPALGAREMYGQAFTPLLVCMIISIPLGLWQVRRESWRGGE